MLLKRYHTLLSKLNISNDEKLVILGAYGVESGRDLTVEQLADLCRRLEMMLVPGLYEADQWRKRVIASVGGWLRALGKDGRNLNEIKAIAARAAGVKSFYEIPQERLRSIYYAFSKKQKDLKFAETLTAEELNTLTNLN